MMGLQPQKIEIEVSGLRGIPGLHIIGLPSKTVSEAKERVTAAIKNSGIRIKSLKTVVNLAPADLKKDTSHLELAIVIGLLKMNEWIDNSTDQCLFLGEFSLDGSLKGVKGALPLVLSARELGFKEVVLPTDNLSEVSLVKNIDIKGVSHLQEYVDYARGSITLRSVVSPIYASPLQIQSDPFAHIHGQIQAKRALMLTATGGHNLLMTGPPGIGKTMLAEVLPQLLPPLGETEILEVNSLLSLCGMQNRMIQRLPPFRAPHYHITNTGLLGGGTPHKPGEITLAHRGILFLDELAEFKTSLLQALRQPLESGHISFSHAQGHSSFPSRFTLVAATNPCPCGYAGVTDKACVCSQSMRDRYQQKVSGPLKDRLDLQVRISKIETPLRQNPPEQNSTSIKQQIITAREKQRQRYQNLDPSLLNAHLQNPEIAAFCTLHPESEKLLLTGAQKLQLSTRAYYKTIKIAQTIADLDNEKSIAPSHIAEALQFRN